MKNVEWAAPYCDIYDKPEYSYRGMMLDVARHFFSVESVKRQIDYAAKYKINKLHMHLADDQGWRLEIKGEMYGESLDKLRTIGASRSCSTNGYNPGQYTQEEFQELAEYAAERYVEITPEFDMPGHTWAALVSLNFLNSTEDGKPHSGSYDNTQPYDGWDVGFSSFECRNEKTYEFIEEVIKQVAPLYPSQYIHIGGDEAHSTSSEDYVYFCNRVTEIAQKYGKTPIGWQNYDSIEITNRDNTVTQFWSTGSAQFKSGVQYVVSAADHAYLDMKYNSNCSYGLTWATMNPIDDAYNWDPTNYGSKDQIVGIEAPMFGETLATDEAWDYMIYPRLLGHAEIGWTPKANRDWSDYRTRLIAHGARLKNQGIQFYEDEDYWEKPVVPVSAVWPMDDGEGTTVSEVGGEYPGTIVGDVEWADGKYGKALKFNSGYVDLNVEGMNKKWTIAVWVNREDNSATNSSLISSTSGELKLEQYNGTNKVGLTEFGNADWTFNYEAPVGEWVHLAFVSDGETTSLYVNGVLTDSLAHVISAPVVRLSANASNGLADSGLLKGTLDELKVLNQALSADEVADLMGEGTVPSPDTTFLEAAIEEANKINLEDGGYVTAGQAEFLAAKAAAEELLEKGASTQGEINRASEALDNARAALRQKADKSILNSTIDRANKLNEADYTEKSWAVLTEALEAAVALQNDPELSTDDQNTIGAAVDALNQAIDELLPSGTEPVFVHMMFDEGEGTSVTDRDGVHTGTITGSVTWVDGKYGKALSFDEGYVDLGIDSFAGDWTIGMWVKREDNDRTNTAVISGAEGELKLEQWKNTKQVGVSQYGVDDWTYDYSTPADEWVHLAFVSSEGKTVLYVNGEKQAEMDQTISVPTLFLGANSRTDLAYRGYMKGAIDDLKIYEVVLTDEQIKAMMEETDSSAVDKSALQRAVDKVKDYKEADYTGESWMAFARALADAQEILADQEATKDEVAAAKTALESAADALQYKPADYTAVDEAIAKSNALNKDEYKDFSAVEAAIKAVVRGKDITEQDAVDKMAKAIEDAIAGLEKIEVPVELPYKDVKEGDWFYDYVYDVYVKELMTGLEETVFAPNNNIVRAQFAVILYRMEGQPEVTFKDTFPDVKDGNFYSDAVIWAADNGIVTGYTGSGLFGPNDPITREQMAAMMFRYANYKKMDTSAREDLSAFPDGKNVQEFATDAVKWCVAEGIVSGKGEDGAKILDPQGNTVRAECATIISRYTGSDK